MMDQAALQDEGMLIKKAMGLAKQLDERDAQMSIAGDFSKNALNRLVDSLNQANRVFRAPTYPRFESGVEALPPEFIRNLQMVSAAAQDAGLTDYVFDLSEVESDKDLKAIAGKIDAAAMDKSFKAYLNKPQGMGDMQDEFGIPEMQMTGADVGVIAKEPMVEEEDEEELFMARMKA